MRRLRDLSIRVKLAASLVTVVSVVLVLSTIAGVYVQHQSSRELIKRQISVLADVLGDASSAALQFDDPVSGEEVLASVRLEPNVAFARTFDAQGNPFASYPASPNGLDHVHLSPAAGDQSVFQGGYLHVMKTIGDADAPMGSIYLRASMTDLEAALVKRIQLAVFSLMVCLGIAMILAFLVQRAIARPIRELAAATERVARNADYSARVESNTNDEIGVLCDGFNAMLQQIEQRDRELDEHRAHLEDLVTERTRSLETKTQELTESNAELERSNQELDDFAYIVSHDLKEPLRGISRYSAFITEDYEDKLDDAGRDKLETLQRLCQRQENLIDSLLHYSRVGRAELAIQKTDLNRVVDEVLDLMQVMLDESGVQAKVPRPLPTIECDSVRIAEVFRNLITNAVKYNDKPEKWVEIGYQSGANGEITWPDGDGNPSEQAGDHHPGEDDYVFYVRDNGIGIREKHQKSVFRIFKRLHARDKFGGGTGAGLTFVKKILERHGGRIWLESSYGEGTTFYFTTHKQRMR